MRFEISTDQARMDVGRVSEAIVTSPWGEGRSQALHERAFANSVCVGAFLDGDQVGFARAVTDRAIFAYVADVFVWPEHRGHGIGKTMMQALLDHPDLATVQYWMLRTADAHSLYEPFGFVTTEDGMFMRLVRQP